MSLAISHLNWSRCLPMTTSVMLTGAMISEERKAMLTNWAK